MFHCFCMIHRKRMDFTVKSVRVKYMVWCIWLAKYNPAISATFVWFLTKQTGSNIGAGLEFKLSKLEERLKSAESTAKEAIKKAKEASKCTAMAGTNANIIKLGLAQLFVRSSTLKK